MNVEHWPDIIREAAQSQLGILALMILAIATISLIFFRNAPMGARLFVFLLLFIGVSIFGFAITRVANGKPPLPTPGPSETLASCQAIKNTDHSAKDGNYKLSRADGSTYKAYCNMTNDGEGWTLVAKIQKDTDHWRFDSPSWTENNANFNVEDFDLMSGEARYPSFESVPLSQIRVVDPTNHRKMTVNLSADNLLFVFRNSNKRNVPVLELSSDLFTFLSSRPDDIWDVCKQTLNELSSRTRVNDNENYPPEGIKSDTGDIAKAQARFGTVGHGSNGHVWSTTGDCAIGLGVMTLGFGGRKIAGTTTRSGFSTIWVR